MALTQNDYRSILGSLRNSTGNGNGSLKVGSYVKNVITPLGEDTIYNPVYSDTTIEEYKTSTWYPVLKSIVSTEIGVGPGEKEIQIGEFEIDTPYFGCCWTPKNLINVTQEIRRVDDESWDLAIGVKNSRNYVIPLQVEFFDFSETVKNGALQTEFSLKKNTSYVLQVLDANSKNNTLVRNSEDSEYSDVWEFDNYLFFRTGSSSVAHFTLTISGLSYGYKILGRDAGNNLIQLRSKSRPIQPRVYLFEADVPWIVDRNGQIVGAIDAPLQTIETDNEEALSATYDKEEVIKLLSRAPKINIVDNCLVVEPDLTEQEKEVWMETWSTKPNIFKNIRLAAMRDYLCPAKQKWNKIQKTSRYGVYRTYQFDDEDSDGYGYVKFHIAPQEWDSDSGWSIPTITLTLDGCSFPALDERKTYYYYNDRFKIHAERFSIPILGLAHGNWDYDKSLHLPYEEWKDYTSFCLVWVTGDGKAINKISNYSIPIIIETGLFTSDSEVQDTGLVHFIRWQGWVPDITISKTQQHKRSIPYYTKEAIFIEAEE